MSCNSLTCGLLIHHLPLTSGVSIAHLYYPTRYQTAWYLPWADCWFGECPLDHNQRFQEELAPRRGRRRTLQLRWWMSNAGIRMQTSPRRLSVGHQYLAQLFLPFCNIWQNKLIQGTAIQSSFRGPLTIRWLKIIHDGFKAEFAGCIRANSSANTYCLWDRLVS